MKKLLSLLYLSTLIFFASTVNYAQSNKDISLATSNGETTTNGAAVPMTLQYNTLLSDGTTISMGLYGFNCSGTINWGDGSAEAYATPTIPSHTYAGEGYYTVSISGTLTRYGDSSIDNTKLLAVNSFGTLGLTNLSYAFYNASNLQVVPGALPVGILNLSYLFQNASTFNQDIGDWDVSTVTDMRNMFYGATAFNQDIGDWDVSNVTDMQYMFASSTSFNQNIGNWDVSKVSKMIRMFAFASSFNQNISNWNVGTVTNMLAMFQSATSFNHALNWDVSKVTNMSTMFTNVSSFNQNISNWTVSEVTDMSGMFNGATAFNQNIGSWDVSKVNNMNNMFKNATSFDQNIGNWAITNVASMIEMFLYATLSTSNYNALLTGWSAQSVKSGITFHAGYSRYSTGVPATARQSLITNKSWTIGDYGPDPMTLVSTQALTGITATKAIGNGNITGLGATNPSQYGVCWNKTGMPTITDNLTQKGATSTTGAFTSTITGLDPKTTYYVRAYATNNAGTAYGEERSFTTLDGMVLHYNTTLSAGTTIYLPFGAHSNVTVDWGDGNIENCSTEKTYPHTYSNEGEYTVALSGILTAFGAIDTDNSKLVRISSFGTLGLTSLNYAFYNALNLQEVPTSLPDGILDFSYLFYGASSFNQNIGNWDVSQVSSMTNMFAYASSFNQNISNWEVDAVTDMSSMFDNASNFNQNISGWNPGEVTNMSQMFNEAVSFNQNIGNWSVYNVNDMTDMFEGVSLSTSNYNALLTGWAAQSVQSGVVFDGGNSKYSTGAPATARALLINNKAWIITDGGTESIPEVSTQAVSDIAATTATGNGTITNLGMDNVSQHGVCWNTTGTPTFSNNITEEGATSSLGMFTSLITGLDPNTTYYVRAYATNSVGTAYGTDEMFSTLGGITNDLIVSDKTVAFGESSCFGALLTITVAGDAKLVEIEDGGEANFIAGQSIRFLPGFHAKAGSTVNAWITITGTYCGGALGSPLLSYDANAEKSVELEEVVELTPEILNEKQVKLYPNPNSGRFTVETSNFEHRIEIAIFTMTGALVYRDTNADLEKMNIDLPYITTGIYHVRVSDGFTVHSLKMIIQ